MGKHKRSKFERERDLEVITDLYLRGIPQTEIATQLGITQQQVSYDVRVIQTRWRTKQMDRINEVKQRELRRIDVLETECWRAWRHSLEDRTKKTIKHTLVSLERETSTGNPAFLAGIQWCISERLRIYGAYAPTQTQNRNLDIDLTLLTDEQLDRVVTGEDLLQVLLTKIDV